MKVLVSQSRPTLCNPSPPGSSVHEISQARILEWVAISFSRGSSLPGMEPGSPALQVDSLLSEPPGRSFPDDASVVENQPAIAGDAGSIPG